MILIYESTEQKGRPVDSGLQEIEGSHTQTTGNQNATNVIFASVFSLSRGCFACDQI